MALTAAQLEQQKQQAEELLFSGPQTLGFAKGLFFGHFNAALLNPYPHVRLDEQSRLNDKLDEVRHYCAEHIDATAIDRNAEIPAEVVAGLGRLGVLGATAPPAVAVRSVSIRFQPPPVRVQTGRRCSRASSSPSGVAKTSLVSPRSDAISTASPVFSASANASVSVAAVVAASVSVRPPASPAVRAPVRGEAARVSATASPDSAGGDPSANATPSRIPTALPAPRVRLHIPDTPHPHSGHIVAASNQSLSGVSRQRSVNGH